MAGNAAIDFRAKLAAFRANVHGKVIDLAVLHPKKTVAGLVVLGALTRFI